MSKTLMVGTGFSGVGGITLLGCKRLNNISQLIKSLFANNEQGFAYDPNDLTTMFQDAAGTVPVTGAGQPVGLMLDKSKGLRKGANLVPQKSFAEGTAGWTLQSGWTLAGGKVVCSGSTSLLLNNTKFGLGKRYRITIAATRTSTSGTLSIRNGATSASTIASINATGLEVVERSVHVSDDAQYIYFLSQGWVGEIISISIEEIAGNHAYQTTSAARPILRQNAITKAYYLEFDGTDDFLMLSPFTLPSPFTLIASLDYTKTAVGAVFSGGVAGYLRSGITSAGVHSVSSPLTVSKRGKDTLTHSSKDAFVTLKSNMETTSLPIAESNPFGNTATKWIGTFSETHTALRCGMGLYGLVAISKSIDSSEENNIRALLNKRLGD